MSASSTETPTVGPGWTVEAARARAETIAGLIRSWGDWRAVWGQVDATLSAWIPPGDGRMAVEKLGNVGGWWNRLDDARTAVLVLRWVVAELPGWWRGRPEFRRSGGEFVVGTVLLVSCAMAARRRVRELCPECQAEVAGE